MTLPRFVRCAVVGVLASAGASSSFAAVSENVSLLLTELMVNGVYVGGAVFAALICIAAFKFLREAI